MANELQGLLGGSNAGQSGADYVNPWSGLTGAQAFPGNRFQQYMNLYRYPGFPRAYFQSQYPDSVSGGNPDANATTTPTTPTEVQRTWGGMPGPGVTPQTAVGGATYPGTRNTAPVVQRADGSYGPGADPNAGTAQFPSNRFTMPGQSPTGSGVPTSAGGGGSANTGWSDLLKLVQQYASTQQAQPNSGLLSARPQAKAAVSSAGPGVYPDGNTRAPTPVPQTTGFGQPDFMSQFGSLLQEDPRLAYGMTYGQQQQPWFQQNQLQIRDKFFGGDQNRMNQTMNQAAYANPLTAAERARLGI